MTLSPEDLDRIELEAPNTVAVPTDIFALLCDGFRVSGGGGADQFTTAERESVERFEDAMIHGDSVARAEWSASRPAPAPLDSGRWVRKLVGVEEIDDDQQEWVLGDGDAFGGVKLARYRGTSRVWGAWSLRSQGIEGMGSAEVTPDDLEAAARIVRHSASGRDTPEQEDGASGAAPIKPLRAGDHIPAGGFVEVDEAGSVRHTNKEKPA